MVSQSLVKQKLTTLNVTGITTTNNLNVTGTATIASIGSTVGISSNFYFGDDKRIYFGQGEDLSVYHDGTHSYINESGVGSLKILTTGLDVRNTADNQRMALFTANGSVRLYHNNYQKIETTIGGIDVTGTTDTDNFVNAGVSTFVGIITASAVGNVIPFYSIIIQIFQLRVLIMVLLLMFIQSQKVSCSCW